MVSDNSNNPYQQLKYLYRTEDYTCLFQLLDQLNDKINENKLLKNKILQEAEYLQLQLEIKNSCSAGGHEVKDINDVGNNDEEEEEDYLLSKLKYTNEMISLEQIFPYSIKETHLTGKELKLFNLRKENFYLKKLLQDKINYNKHCLKLVTDYQDAIQNIISNLHYVVEQRNSEKIEEFKCQHKIIEEKKKALFAGYNEMVDKMSRISALTDILE
ncbi:hypothetical protein PACTADRAFT_48103 [Pachysolen tannophilus NRRL Y-2460]|uniref:Uncharacterized protein n=1 Tax=Pachysolen tannophilus NRRL Y-2460 TaxID=669874 RepID=A0A1E4U2U3_PACTA|nr:hypothetical protein PACTADRAFT_48103 [Pachysolen tannophilus NRRL Y-2460]